MHDPVFTSVGEALARGDTEVARAALRTVVGSPERGSMMKMTTRLLQKLTSLPTGAP